MPIQPTTEDLLDEINDLERRLSTAEHKATFADGVYVNVYRLDRCYGGPEEGGWWFDAGNVVHSFQMTSLTQAEALVTILRQQFTDGGHRYSVRPNDEDYAVAVEPTPGESFPKERPFYE
jgi:hypothetical protein